MRANRPQPSGHRDGRLPPNPLSLEPDDVMEFVAPPAKRGTSKFLLTLVLVGLVVALAMACGPVQSTSGISAAEGSLERARVHDAERYSPYEYYRAQHYLYKAKEEWGYSNFEIARDYAREARRSADAANANAREAPWRGHPIYGFEEWNEEFEQLMREFDEAEQRNELEELDQIHGN